MGMVAVKILLAVVVVAFAVDTFALDGAFFTALTDGFDSMTTTLSSFLSDPFGS